MKYLAMIDQGEHPVDYVAVSDAIFGLLPEMLEEEGLEANFVEVKDEELIAELDESLNLFLSIEGSSSKVDRHGNFYEITKSPYKWGRWVIRVM